MEMKDVILKEFIKNGYAKNNGNRVWNLAERRFLYMTPDLAEGFLNLKNFDPYRKQVVEREVDLIKQNTDKISESLKGESFNLIDIYCGDGTKAVEFIKTFKLKGKIKYCPMNVSKHLVDLAVKNVQKAGFGDLVEFEPYVFESDSSINNFLKSIKEKGYNRNVVLLLGSVLASYDINDYLYLLSQNMSEGDFLLIGNGIRTGERLSSLNTYKEKVWHDWFKHLMKELSFKDEDLEYNARFGNSRVELFYKLKNDKSLDLGGQSVSFKTGDEVLVAVLYKYFPEEFEKFCKMYFSDVALIKDKDSEYALVMCKK